MVSSARGNHLTSTWVGLNGLSASKIPPNWDSARTYLLTSQQIAHSRMRLTTGRASWGELLARSAMARRKMAFAVPGPSRGKINPKSPESRANTMPLPFDPCSEFTLRPRSDGTFDAICTKCFLTAGTIRQESDLEAIKRTHECHRSVLSSLAYEDRVSGT